MEKQNVKRLNPIKLKQLEERLAFVENEIPKTEECIALAEESLGRFVSAEDSQRIAAQLEGLRKKRGDLLAEWEELALALEEQDAPV